MKKTHLSFILFLVIIFVGVEHTYASTEESNVPPINFQVEMLHWKDVNEFLPRYTKFTVIDVESGKSFDVQRRAGMHHADVQPLTRKDTKIMKEIYNGHWSWRRRAILIQSHNRLIAASMHGMPHGAGALENGFSGHFCIHFIGSTTHRSEKSDLSHQVMISKAGGTIDEFIESLTPPQLLNTFMVFVKNGDKGLVKKVAITNKKNIKNELKKIDNIEAIRWNLFSSLETEPYSLEAEVPVEVKLIIKDTGPIKTKLSFTFVRTSPLSPWKINLDPLMSVIEQS
jgi:hypothetical protein